MDRSSSVADLRCVLATRKILSLIRRGILNVTRQSNCFWFNPHSLPLVHLHYFVSDRLPPAGLSKQSESHRVGIDETALIAPDT